MKRGNRSALIKSLADQRPQTWRERAAELIWTLKQGQPGITRRELRAYYPWGERKGYPYRVWCLEARALIGPGRRAALGSRLSASREDGNLSLPFPVPPRAESPELRARAKRP
jgi:hypothetical protein